MVKVYSITQCPWCDKVKKYLKSRGVAYEEHNIELSDADRDEWMTAEEAKAYGRVDEILVKKAR